jgi:4-hydroxybenzoate polyprenyltransferase
MFSLVRRLLEMIRFSHTLFALPFALLAAVMAWTMPTPESEKITFQSLHLIGILICMIGARSAAMAFNRLVDAKYDAANPRTATRHIPAGTLSSASVVWFTLMTSVIFVLGTLCFLPQNPLPIVLAIPVLLFLLGYSYAKRFTAFAHYWLGLALALAPVSAWIALRGEVLMQQPTDILPALMLGAAVWFWVAGFDIIYACQDYAFDAAHKLHSIPAKLGVPGALRLAAISHVVTIIFFFALPFIAPQLGLGTLYLIGVSAVTLLLVYEHAIVSASDLTRVNAAFFNVNVIISIGLFCIGCLDLLWF